jgi:hypothetical protein
MVKDLGQWMIARDSEVAIAKTSGLVGCEFEKKRRLLTANGHILDCRHKHK